MPELKATESRRGVGMIKKYKWWFVGIAVMVAEGLLFMLLLPDSSMVVEGAAVAPGGNVASKDMVEKPLGEKLQISNVADPAVPLRIDCSIYAAVPTKDEAAFDALMETKKYRVMEVVTTVLRRAGYEQLQEPSLATIKRQLKEAVTDVLGKDKPYVESIIIPDFKSIEL